MEKKDTYNYKLLRTPDTYLTKTELEYCYCDVRGLSECIQAMLVEDDVTTIPLTSTGYVRRDCRNAMNTKEWRQIFKKCELNTKQYKLLREIFRGGDTHANRKYAGKIIENVRSKDIESSYPARCMLSYFPCGKLTKVSINTIEEYEKYSNKYCVMFRANFWGLKIHEDEPFPYIPIAKTIYRSNVVNDNGRILKASYIQMSLTEIDMQIIQEQYDMDGFTIEEAYISTRGQLPIELMQVIIDYYNSKTSLKGIADCYYEYMKKKNKLNSTYGMMVSSIVHNIIMYECGKWVTDSEDAEKALKKYFSGRNNFLLYQHGVYVTAHARKELREGVKLVKECAVYQDTDAVKFFKYPMSIFDKLNEEKEKEAENNIVPAIAYDKDKRLHHMGIWDDDGEYPLFKTLGAKKYAYTDKDGEFHITVSGMSKELGAKAIKKIENFEVTGTPLNDVGRTTSWYNEENIHEISITDYRGKESTFTTASNIAVLDSTYEIGITGEYAEVLKKYVDVSCIV